MVAVPADAKKAAFRKNFFRDFVQVLNCDRRLGPGGDPPHPVQVFEHCDFKPIAAWLEQETQKQRDIPAESKLLQRELQQEREEPYRWAIVDGFRERVGNMTVEPPGRVARNARPRLPPPLAAPPASACGSTADGTASLTGVSAAGCSAAAASTRRWGR